MLTENEREWLAEREKDALYFCRHCHRKSIHCRIRGFCPTANSNFRDASEFEARVAAKLAEIFDESTEIAPLCPSCPCENDCYDGKLKCKAAILKYARLAVEEEMDADR